MVVTYRDKNSDFGAIEVFSAYPELNSIMKKVLKDENFSSIMAIIFSQNRFNLESLYRDYPEFQHIIGSEGKDKRFRNNIFDKIPLFTENKVNDDDFYILGLVKNKRVYRYFPKQYTDLNHENLLKWKVLLPLANGSGAIGEVLSTPLVGEPLVGYTQSFIGIGAFDNKKETENCLKYIKSKFARLCLGILKITQHNNRDTWKYVPLQDFTDNSDIDWNRSIAEIDRQLYAKYGLSPEEIDFIETRVKEME